MSQNVYFYPLEIVSRYRDPQFQVDKITYLSLKGLAQAKIIKKSVILFRVLNMTI